MNFVALTHMQLAYIYIFVIVIFNDGMVIRPFFTWGGGYGWFSALVDGTRKWKFITKYPDGHPSGI